MGATALPQHLVPRRTSLSLHTNRKHPEGNDTSTNRPGQTARPPTTVICAKPEFSRKVHTAHERIHLRRESLAGGGARGEAPPPRFQACPGAALAKPRPVGTRPLSPAAGGSRAPPRGDGLRGARALWHPAPPPSAPTEGPVWASRWRVTFPAYETKDPKRRRAPHASQSGVPSGHPLPHFLSTSPQTQTRRRAPGGWKPGAEGTGPGRRPSPGDEDTETCCSDSEHPPRGFRETRLPQRGRLT